MRELIQKVISGFVVLIYCLTLVPAQEFSNLSAGKQRLDFYLDKAGQENLENNWLEVAEEGIISAMELWENENAYLKDIDSGEYETLKKNARTYYETLKTERYVDWIVNYFAREQKAQSFAELKKQIQNEITTFDVSSYSLSEASVLFNDIDKSTKEITQKYIENFDINNGFYYSELSVRLAETGLSDDQKERLIKEMSENVNESLSAESEMLSEKEGSRFLLRFLKDENSLRAKNAGEAASIVAKDLAENAYKETSEEMEILFSQLKKDIESSGTNEVSSESILEQFQNVMKRGLAKWEEAELEFLTDRADWEKNAGLVYQQGNEIWDAAFAELQVKKVEWQKNISEKLREVELAAEQKSDDFQKEIEDIYTAYAQQLNNSQQIQLQIVNTLETVNYTLRDAIATSREGIESWYNIWGEKYNGVYSYWKTEDAFRNQFVNETPNGNSIITVDVYNSGNDLEQVQEIIETYLDKEQQMLIKIYKDTTDKYHSEIEQSQKKLNNLIETYAEREEIKVSNSSFYGSTVDYEHVLFNWETGFTSEYEEKAFSYFENGLNEYFLDTDEDTVDEEEVNYYTTLYKSYIDSYKDNISKYKALINQKDDFIEKIESLTNQAKETYQTDTAGSVFNELEKFVTDTKETTALSDNETFEYQAAKHRAFTSLVNWYKQLNEYKKLYEENIKSFEALKNQNSENEVQNPELGLQLQKAKLNRDYFEEQYQIAKAVNDYAEISDAGRESQKITEDNLTEAGKNYAEQLRKYNEAVRELENYEKALKAAGDVIVKAEEKIKDVQTAISQKQMEYESIMAAQNNLDIKLTAELLRREIESLDAIFDTQDESSNQISAELKKNRNEEYQSYRQIETAVLNEYKAYASEIQNASTCLASAERGAYFESLDKISVKFAEEENLNFWYLNILNLANECDSLFKEESPLLSESLKNFYKERYITQINAYFELMAKYSREVQNGISDNKKHEDSISVKDADYLSFIKEVLLLDAENNSEVIDLINEYETADTEIKQSLIARWNKENRTDILSIVKGTYEFADDSLSAAFNALKSENTGLTRLWKEFSDNVSAYYEYGNSYNAELFIGKFETNDAKIKAALSKLDSCHDYTEIINGLMEVTQVMESLHLSKTTSMAASYYLDAFMQREALNYVENTSNRSIIKNHYNELTEIAPSENADESDELEEIKKNTVLRSDIEIQFLKYAITEIDSDKYSWIEKLNNCGFTDSEIFASKDSKNKFKELLNGFNEKIHKYKDNYAKTFLSYFNEAQPVTEEQSDEVQVSDPLDELLAVIKVQYEIYNQKTNQDKIKENANTVLQVIEKLEAELNEKKKAYDEAVINYTNAGTSYNEYVQNLENQYLKLEEYRLEKRKAQAVKDWAESIYLNNIGQSYDDSYVTPKEVLAQAEYAFKVADLSYNMLEELISQGTASSKLPWQEDRDKYTASEKNYYNSLILNYEIGEIFKEREEALITAEENLKQAHQMFLTPEEIQQDTESDKQKSENPVFKYVTIGKNGEKYVYSLNVEVEQIEVYKDIVITDDDGNETIETVFDSYKQKLKFTDKNKDSSKEIAGLKDEKILVDNLLTEDYTTTRFDTEAEKFISEMITISDDENQTVNCDKLKKVMLAYQYLLYLSKGCDDLTQNYYKDYYKDPSDNSIWNTMGAGNKHKVDYIDYYHDYRYEVIKAAYEELQAKNELSYLARYFVVRSGNNILARMAPELEENILMEAAGAKLQKKMKKIKENHTYWFWRDHVGNYAKECQSAAERIINSARTNINDDLIIFKSLLSQLKSAESGKKTALKNYNNIYYGCDEKPSDTDSIRITKTDAQKKIETCLKNANSKLSDKEISKLTGLLSESETADYKTLADAIREICTKSLSEYVQAKEVLNDNIITQSEKFSASVLKYDSALISAQSLNEVQLADLRKLALKASDVTLSLAERKAASEEYDRIYKEYLESGLLQAETTLSELASNFVSDSFDSQKYYDWLKDNYYSYFDSDTLKIDLNKRMESYILNSSEGTDSYYEMFESFYSGYLKNIDSYRLNSYWLELENTRRTAEQENKDAVKLVKDVILAGVREWEKAERTLNTQRNSWAKNFIDKYEKETAVWQMNYNDFLEDKQEWINNLYIDALSETAVTENREQDISRHLVNTRKALREELSDDFAVDFDSASIVENLLGDTCLSKIEGLVAGGKNRIDENRITARTALSFDSNLSTLLKAQSVMNEVTEKMEKTAAARIAQEAVKNLEEMRRSYEGSISVENKQVRDSIRKQAINLGYEYSDTSIKRKVAVDATFWGPVYETQKVKIYEDFATAGPKLSVDLNSLTLMEGAVLTVAMKNARNELDMWYTKVFGTEDSPDDGKIYLGYNADGLFGQHVGIGGKLKDNGIDPNKGLSRNIAKDGEGTGQMGRIMLDFAWNEVMLANGFAELGKPAWDQKLWSGDGFLGLEPPSLRVVSTIAAGIVASIVTWGAASGVAGVMTAAAVSASITMSNELMFAALDVTGGYKSPYEVGKSLAVSAATSVLGAAAGGAGAAAGSLNGIGGVALKTGITASNATMTQATNAFIMSGGDFESVRRSFNSFEDWSGIISQSAGAFVANSMTYATSGYQILDESTGERYWSKLSGFNSEQISSIQSLSSLTGGLTSSAVDLGLTGNTTFNVASIKGTGVFELTVGKDGLSSRLGSSGTDISFGKISSALLGVQTAVVNSKIIDYADKNKKLVGIDTALRVQYGFGDARAQEQFESILNGSTVVKAGKGDGRAVTVIEDGKRTVYLNNIGDNMTRQQQLDMGITLGHEAWRDGITDSNNMAETIYAVIGHSAIALNMSKDIAYEKSMENIFTSDNRLATDVTKYDAWTKAIAAGDNATADNAFADLAVNVLENYDSTGDYWKLVEHDNGTFGVKFDGNHSLVDEYGNVLVKNDMDIFDNDGNIIGHKTGMSFSASLGMLLGTYTNYLDSSADYKNGKNPTQEDIVRGIDDKGYIGKDDKSPTEMYLKKLGFSWNTKNATWENINNPNATIPINSYTMTLVDLIAGNGVDLKDGFAYFKMRDEKNNIVGEASVPYGDGLDRYLAFENMIPQGDLLKAGIFKVDNSGNVQMYGVSSTLPTPTEFGEKHPAIADGTYAFKFDMHYPPNGSPYDALRLFNKDYQNIPINVNAVTGEKKHNPIYRSNVPGFYFDKIKAILKATTDSINYHRTNSGGFMDATRRTGSLGCITTFPSQYWRSLPNSKSNRAIDGYFYINRTLYNFY